MPFLYLRQSLLTATILLTMLASPLLLAASNDLCLGCHGYESDGIPMVNGDTFGTSVHSQLNCTSCHTTVRDYPHPDKHTPIACASCHKKENAIFTNSIHGQVEGSHKPTCTSCHTNIHAIVPSTNPASSVYHLNLPATCGKCHGDAEVISDRKIKIGNAFQQYIDSVHGHAVIKSGLMVGANCSDCHGSHNIQKQENPESPINRANIAKTCGKCHEGIETTYNASIHGQEFAKDNPSAPACNDCHQSHSIKSTSTDGWKLASVDACGMCHDSQMATYRNSYHGKVTKLGFTEVARCSDCHGYHTIQPSSNPTSLTNIDNKATTCQKCHEDSSAMFAMYFPHADYHDKDNYPGLHALYVIFNWLLIGVFVFWGIHSLLWFIRSVIDHQQRGWPAHHKPTANTRYFWRFPLFHRITHALIITSFLGLAFSGLPLKFSDRPWALWIANFLGGFQVAGFIHRFCAILTFVYCGLHLWFIIVTYRKERNLSLFWGPDSLVPQLRDAQDMFAHIKWFLGMGPRPRFGRWTYWEKFDYWAVFWGIAIIGSSGMILWHPTFFSHWLPGWIINVATLIHSDEALLAIGFIFTIHFFNGHMRPEKFPMDTVMFTGRLTEEEFALDKPEQYAKMKADGTLETLLTQPPEKWLVRFSKVFGFAALSIGILLILLIILVH